MMLFQEGIITREHSRKSEFDECVYTASSLMCISGSRKGPDNDLLLFQKALPSERQFAYTIMISFVMPKRVVCDRMTTD